MRLSRASSYAINAIIQLAEGPDKVPLPCSKLSQNGDMPERFLLQVLRNLVNHGLVKSIRGVDGGYYLVKPPAEVSLLEVIEATDGPLTPTIPPLDGLSKSSQDKVQSALNDVVRDTSRRLSKIRVADLKSANGRA